MAEELLLLAYRPRGTPSVNLEMLDYTLSAAVLAELVILNRVTLENGHLRVRAPEPTGDTELDETLQRLATHPGPPPAFGDWWISMYTPERRSRLPARRAHLGVRLAGARLPGAARVPVGGGAPPRQGDHRPGSRGRVGLAVLRPSGEGEHRQARGRRIHLTIDPDPWTIGRT